VILRPLNRDEVNAVIEAWHRHHDPIRQMRFAVGAFVGDGLRGVAVVEWPKAAALANGVTFEISRVATPNRARCTRPDGACSALAAACWRSLAALGARRLVTYTRQDESGASYRAAGFVATARVVGREWSGINKPGRWLPGFYDPSTEIIDRIRWEIGPDRAPSVRV
jgi:hypothetical protein